MSQIVPTLLASLALLILLASVAVWATIVQRLRARRPLAPYEPRRPVPWTLAEIIATAGIYLIILLGTAFWLVGEPPKPAAPDDVHAVVKHEADHAEHREITPAHLAAQSITNVLTVVVVIVLLRSWSGASWEDLGLSLAKLGNDLQLGGLTFLAVVLPVYAMQAVLSHWISGQHPVVELVTKNRGPEVLVLTALTTVVVAPLAEEFLFRVLLQGWLEALWSQRRELIEPLSGTVLDQPQPGSVDDVILPSGDENPYATSRAEIEVNHGEGARPTVRPSIWPVVISALIFALMHLGNGPDPIPLFFLAMALGYVYQRTHRIWPGLVVHFCLNGLSMSMLAAGVGS